MEIIAETEDGYLIQGTRKEVQEILRAVHGTVPKEIPLGQKIPAIDYASTITKLQNLAQDSNYQTLQRTALQFQKRLEGLDEVVTGMTKL